MGKLMQRHGRIAAYLQLPEAPTDLVFAERALLNLADRCGWSYVRFFRDRHNTIDQWDSLMQAMLRGEILGLVMMSVTIVPAQDNDRFIDWVMKQGIRLLTVTEGLDSWTDAGRLWLMGQMS